MVKKKLDNDIVRKALYERLDVLFDKLEILNRKSNFKLQRDDVSS